MTRVTRRYKFAASHRLHSAHFSEDENRELYGKCTNPYGHGHDYALSVTVAGPLDAVSGQVVNIAVLDRLVEQHILRDFGNGLLIRIAASGNPAADEVLIESIGSLAWSYRQFLVTA